MLQSRPANRSLNRKFNTKYQNKSLPGALPGTPRNLLKAWGRAPSREPSSGPILGCLGPPGTSLRPGVGHFPGSGSNRAPRIDPSIVNSKPEYQNKSLSGGNIGASAALYPIRRRAGWLPSKRWGVGKFIGAYHTSV